MAYLVSRKTECIPNTLEYAIIRLKFTSYKLQAILNNFNVVISSAEYAVV